MTPKVCICPKPKGGKQHFGSGVLGGSQTNRGAILIRRAPARIGRFALAPDCRQSCGKLQRFSPKPQIWYHGCVRTLLILRHSKSGHDQPVSDKQRTLTSQGRKDARRMGELARERNSIPDRVLCSTATRARETIEFFAQGAKLKQPVDFLDALYLADPAAILRVIREHARASELVMVVGHNPGLQGLVAKLTGEHIELPTTALAECALPIQSWSDLEGKIAGTLLAILKPKDQP